MYKLKDGGGTEARTDGRTHTRSRSRMSMTCHIRIVHLKREKLTEELKIKN